MCTCHYVITWPQDTAGQQFSARTKSHALLLRNPPLDSDPLSGCQLLLAILYYRRQTSSFSPILLFYSRSASSPFLSTHLHFRYHCFCLPTAISSYLLGRPVIPISPKLPHASSLDFACHSYGDVGAAPAIFSVTATAGFSPPLQAAPSYRTTEAQRLYSTSTIPVIANIATPHTLARPGFHLALTRPPDIRDSGKALV